MKLEKTRLLHRLFHRATIEHAHFLQSIEKLVCKSYGRCRRMTVRRVLDKNMLVALTFSNERLPARQICKPLPNALLVHVLFVRKLLLVEVECHKLLSRQLARVVRVKSSKLEVDETGCCVSWNFCQRPELRQGIKKLGLRAP